MPDPIKTESPADLAGELRRGRSERTPAIAITTMSMAIGVLVCVILLAALLVYYFA